VGSLKHSSDIAFGISVSVHLGFTPNSTPTRRHISLILARILRFLSGLNIKALKHGVLVTRHRETSPWFNLKRYAKGKWTQLQFIFEACDSSPNGVKLSYRAFSNDEVDLFKRLPPRKRLVQSVALYWMSCKLESELYAELRKGSLPGIIWDKHQNGMTDIPEMIFNMVRPRINTLLEQECMNLKTQQLKLGMFR
jgi:hypothetical protein